MSILILVSNHNPLTERYLDVRSYTQNRHCERGEILLPEQLPRITLYRRGKNKNKGLRDYSEDISGCTGIHQKHPVPFPGLQYFCKNKCGYHLINSYELFYKLPHYVIFYLYIILLHSIHWQLVSFFSYFGCVPLILILCLQTRNKK